MWVHVLLCFDFIDFWGSNTEGCLVLLNQTLQDTLERIETLYKKRKIFNWTLLGLDLVLQEEHSLGDIISIISVWEHSTTGYPTLISAIHFRWIHLVVDVVFLSIFTLFAPRLSIFKYQSNDMLTLCVYLSRFRFTLNFLNWLERKHYIYNSYSNLNLCDLHSNCWLKGKEKGTS